ncbi:MAG: beta-galactosidase GalB [Opitutaceae bacterium]|jgi:beta-galactosidase
MRMPCASWICALCLIASLFATVSLRADAAAPRERVSFDAGWRFTRGDPADAGQRLAYENIKPWVLATGTGLIGAARPKPVRPEGNPGGDISYVQPGFDDRGWRELNLPHDWGIEGPFSQDLPGDTGKLPWAGVGWYRKHFTEPAADAGRQIFLDVDGAMAYSAVWLNGQFVGGWPYGYSSFRLDLTPHFKWGAENVLAVRLDNPPNSSRWYPGSGLYRNVWLVKTPLVHFAHWGVFVTTPRILGLSPSNGTAEAALVNVDFELENLTAPKAAFDVTTRIYELGPDEARGAEPVATSAAVRVEIDPARASAAARSNLLTVPQPKLWDLEHPHRYVAVTTLTSEGKVVDECVTPFGIRTIAFDPDRGFLLNGRHVPLQGVCDHHDLGALGTAINRRALERQIQLLQAMGCNAIRTSHNPPAPELLELCDRLGMLVMDEAFDCWHRGKKLAPGSHRDDPQPGFNDYARVFDDWYERDLRALVCRDRNHPCVILWSIGNEVIEQWYSDGWQYARTLAGIVREEDRTRPITSAFNGPDSGYNGFQTAVDVVGYNYKPGEYGPFHAAHPTIPVVGSETASCVSSRGEYFFPVSEDKAEGRADFQVSSYDRYAPRWALRPDVEFKGLDEAPFAAGEFVWTGFDYLGEPTPYNADVTNLLNFSDPAEQARMAKELKELGRIRVPSRSSYFGIIDLAGFPKDRFFIYQARWRPDFPMAHLLPHWNWPERVGQVTPVQVYTSGDEAELFLNGKSLGRKQRGPLEYRLCWNEVKYEPGELRVVAYQHGRKWAEDVVKTTGPAAKVMLTADRAALTADGSDLSFVTVTIADQAGLLVPRSKNLVKFEIAGPGEIVAVDNGDATSFEPFQARERKAYNGLALVVVRTKAGEPGVITLKAQSDGLAAAEISLQSTVVP